MKRSRGCSNLSDLQETENDDDEEVLTTSRMIQKLIVDDSPLNKTTSNKDRESIHSASPSVCGLPLELWQKNKQFVAVPSPNQEIPKLRACHWNSQGSDTQQCRHANKKFDKRKNALYIHEYSRSEGQGRPEWTYTKHLPEASNVFLLEQ